MTRILQLTALPFTLAILALSTRCWADDNQAAQDKNWQDDFSCFLRPPVPVIREDTPFSTKEWTDLLAIPNRCDGDSVFREVEFRKLLRDYNLIGMSRKRVIELLGPEDYSAHYTLVAGSCANRSESVHIRYGNDDIVTGWRIEGCFGRHQAGGWIE